MFGLLLARGRECDAASAADGPSAVRRKGYGRLRIGIMEDSFCIDYLPLTVVEEYHSHVIFSERKFFHHLDDGTFPDLFADLFLRLLLVREHTSYGSEPFPVIVLVRMRDPHAVGDGSVDE